VGQRADFATIAPYTLEETYEVLDAISREDFDDLRGELGDLLFQVVFYAQMAQEEGALTLTISARHQRQAGAPSSPYLRRCYRRNSSEVLARWEQIKSAERAENPAFRAGRHSA
jgi:ATP diphosphatase